MLLSAREPRDVGALRELVIETFEASMIEEELVAPYGRQSALGEIYENTRVVREDYDEGGARLVVRGLPAAIGRLRQTLR